MKKEHLYETAWVRKDSSLEHLRGQCVKIVKYHDYNDTFSIRSIAGELQCMVERSNLERFVL